MNPEHKRRDGLALIGKKDVFSRNLGMKEARMGGTTDQLIGSRCLEDEDVLA